MATKYLITLTPHEKFFFGNERTFGDSNANYLVESRYFPQQTALLGLLRHQMLLQCNDPDIFHNNRIQNTEEAKKLIGDKSFTLNGEFDFGKIKSLSPVFISFSNGEEKDYFFPANREYLYVKKYDDNCKKIEKIEMIQPEAIDKNFGKQLNEKPLIKVLHFNPKYEMPDLLINKSLEKKKYGDIYIPHKQVGIRKDYKGQTKEDAFYVQTFWKMQKGYGFSFIAELDDFKLNGERVVAFGGEQQLFRMDVEEFNEGFDDLLPEYEASGHFHKVVLVSDACVEKDIINQFDFAVTKTGDFRFLVTDNNQENYAGKPAKSQKFDVYLKGSVFYYSDKNKNVKSVFEQLNLKGIGYNHFKIIYKKTNH